MNGSEHEDRVRRSFERQAALFSGPDSPFAHRHGTLAWIEPLTHDMVVLDVACGAAHAAESVAPHVRRVVGIDLTRALLVVGTTRLHDNAVGGVVLEEGNAEALPHPDAAFDVVFCRGSLHHFADPHGAVAEMVRVCRPGGRLVLVELVAPPGVDRTRFDHLHRLLDPSHVGTFTETEVVDLLPGGIEAVTYADTFTVRLPIDAAITEQSERAEILRMIGEELDGGGEPTGFEPVAEEGRIVVGFTTCVVHGIRP